jgi:hypothetical protein
VASVLFLQTTAIDPSRLCARITPREGALFKVARACDAARAQFAICREMEPNETDRPFAYVAHRVPGRARINVPARRGDAAFLGGVAARLGAAPPVAAAIANPRTGSIVLRHEGPLEPILAEASTVVRFGAAPPAVRATPRARAPRRMAMLPFSPLQGAAVGFAALAALQLARGRVTGSAAEHFWAAHNALRTLRGPGIALALAGIGAIQLARGQVLSPAVSLLFYAAQARQQARGG